MVVVVRDRATGHNPACSLTRENSTRPAPKHAPAPRLNAIGAGASPCRSPGIADTMATATSAITMPAMARLPGRSPRPRP